jgi:putative hydrolase of the HAD superfamily
MNSDLKGVFFDYGGVIENIAADEALFRRGVTVIAGLLEEIGIGLKADELFRELIQGHKQYDSWYRENDHRELPNAKIWTSFFLKERCQNKDVREWIQLHSEELSSIYEFYLFKRRPPGDMVEVLRKLFQNRYTLAIISNTMSMTLIPERLKKFGVDRYMGAVVLSINTGIRKPRSEIFLKALEQTGLAAERCMFVGDTLTRDIEGSKNAGFYKSVLIRSGVTDDWDRDYKGSVVPDHTISTLGELIDLVKR